ncbi:MAG: tetratricopeptide repeat protein [Alphaproteobacteria bacterium]|nr:tetratricopeptide repeat protein [Alphaproteobacteria bacterium]
MPTILQRAALASRAPLRLRLATLLLCAVALPVFAACADSRVAPSSSLDPAPRFGLRAGVGFSVAQADPADASARNGPIATRRSPFADAGMPRGGVFGSYLAGRFAQRETDTGAAAAFLSRALLGEPDNRDLLRQTLLANLGDGRDEEAIRLARAALDAGAGERVLPSLIVIAGHARAADWAGAEARLRSLPATGLGEILQPLLLAWALAGRNDTNGALAVLRPVAESANHRLRSAYALHAAMIADLADRPEEAGRFFDRALAPGNGQARDVRQMQIVASFWARRGEREKAERLADEFFAQSQSSDLAAAHPGARRAIAERAVSSPAEGMAEALLSLASAMRQQDATEPALAMLRIALMLRPRFATARLVLSELFESEQRYEAAAEMLESIADGDMLGITARLREAVLLDRLDRTEDAIAVLERLAAAHAERPEPLLRMGDVLRGRQRFAEAVAAYDRAAERIGPINQRRHWVFLYSRGIALERSGQWPRAEADFSKALEFVPDQPYVLNYLGYSWIERGMHLDRAKGMVERAVQLRPDDGHITDSLGWAYYMMGNYAEAVRWLERAVELTPRDAVITDHLGDAYWRVGRQEEARFQWQRALRLEPEADLVPRIEKKLREGLPPAPTPPAAASAPAPAPAPARP